REHEPAPFSFVKRVTSRHGKWIAVGLALATAAVGLSFGARVAAGADSYGYVSQALLWAHGSPVQLQPLVALQAPWPNAEWSFCPLGYKPGPVSGVMVPTYSAGLPLMMAALVRPFGITGAWLVVPLCGALTVACTYWMARTVCGRGPLSALCALLVASSPVFLMQL